MIFDKRYFGANVKRIRKSRGMSQADLAKELNIPATTISSWENAGVVPKAITRDSIAKYENGVCSPYVSTISRIATALGCSVAELFGEVPPEKRMPIDEIEIVVRVNGEEILLWENRR